MIAAIHRHHSPITRVGMNSGPFWPTIKKPIATICKAVFHLESFVTGMPVATPARNSLKPDTTISLHKMTTAGSKVLPEICPKPAKSSIVAATSNLSATGSKNLPKADCWLQALARYPSRKSVNAAIVKSPHANH